MPAAKKTSAKSASKTSVKASKIAKPVEDGFVVTREGYKALVDELENLKTVRRRQVAERLKEAISYGDLSENSEYEEAKNEQAFVEGRILELEEMVKTAKVVEEKASGGKEGAEIGSKVTIKNLTTKAEIEVMLVGSTESDPFAGRISNESPLGTALLGANVGDVVKVVMPAGTTEYELLRLA